MVKDWDRDKYRKAKSFIKKASLSDDVRAQVEQNIQAYEKKHGADREESIPYVGLEEAVTESVEAGPREARGQLAVAPGMGKLPAGTEVPDIPEISGEDLTGAVEQGLDEIPLPEEEQPFNLAESVQQASGAPVSISVPDPTTGMRRNPEYAKSSASGMEELYRPPEFVPKDPLKQASLARLTDPVGGLSALASNAPITPAYFEEPSLEEFRQFVLERLPMVSPGAVDAMDEKSPQYRWYADMKYAMAYDQAEKAGIPLQRSKYSQRKGWADTVSKTLSKAFQVPAAVARGGTGGLSDYALYNDDQRKLQALLGNELPAWVEIPANIVGAFAPASLPNKLYGAASKAIPELGRRGGQLISETARGAATGLAENVIEQGARGLAGEGPSSAAESVEELALSTALGGGFGLGMPLLGMGARGFTNRLRRPQGKLKDLPALEDEVGASTTLSGSFKMPKWYRELEKEAQQADMPVTKYIANEVSIPIAREVMRHIDEVKLKQRQEYQDAVDAYGEMDLHVPATHVVERIKSLMKEGEFTEGGAVPPSDSGLLQEMARGMVKKAEIMPRSQAQMELDIYPANMDPLDRAKVIMTKEEAAALGLNVGKLKRAWSLSDEAQNFIARREAKTKAQDARVKPPTSSGKKLQVVGAPDKRMFGEFSRVNPRPPPAGEIPADAAQDALTEVLSALNMKVEDVAKLFDVKARDIDSWMKDGVPAANRAKVLEAARKSRVVLARRKEVAPEAGTADLSNRPASDKAPAMRDKDAVLVEMRKLRPQDFDKLSKRLHESDDPMARPLLAAVMDARDMLGRVTIAPGQGSRKYMPPERASQTSDAYRGSKEQQDKGRAYRDEMAGKGQLPGYEYQWVDVKPFEKLKKLSPEQLLERDEIFVRPKSGPGGISKVKNIHSQQNIDNEKLAEAVGLPARLRAARNRPEPVGSTWEEVGGLASRGDEIVPDLSVAEQRTLVNTLEKGMTSPDLPESRGLIRTVAERVGGPVLERVKAMGAVTKLAHLLQATKNPFHGIVSEGGLNAYASSGSLLTRVGVMLDPVARLLQPAQEIATSGKGVATKGAPLSGIGRAQVEKLIEREGQGILVKGNEILPWLKILIGWKRRIPESKPAPVSKRPTATAPYEIARLNPRGLGKPLMPGASVVSDQELAPQPQTLEDLSPDDVDFILQVVDAISATTPKQGEAAKRMQDELSGYERGEGYSYEELFGEQ